MEYNYDVFISYSRKDTDVANAICDAMEKRGVTYFIDRQGVGGGMEFPEVLAKAILGSRLFLFLASENSYKSKFTNSEITFAFNEKNKESILPYIIDGSVLPVNLRLVFSGINWRNIEEHPITPVLINDILRLIGKKTDAKWTNQNHLKQEETDELIGTVLCGKKKTIFGKQNQYKINKIIGRGKTGVVYQAQLANNPMERYAIKRLFVTDLRNYQILDTSDVVFRGTKNDCYQMFVNAYKSLSSMRHHSLVQNIELIEYAQTPFWVMEYLEGDDLYNHILNNPMSEIEVIHVIKDVLKGLNYMHSKGFLHCDIKPQNIVFCPNGESKIIDFSTMKNFHNWTTGDHLWFTRPYAPVEIANSSYLHLEILKETIDIYSVGATMFHLLTNEIPLSALCLQSTDFFSPLESIGLTPEIVKIVKKAMEYDYHNRYQNALEFIRDIESLPRLNPYPLYKPLSKETIELREKSSATTEMEATRIWPPSHKRVASIVM